LILTERHPADHPPLEAEFAGDRQVAVHFKDGYTAPEAFTPPRERRGLVLMDPAFEMKGEFHRLLDAVQRIHRRWASGTVAVWYPIGERAPSERFHRELKGLGIPAILCAELGLYPYDTPNRLGGSGMVILNPPWQTDLALARMLPEILQRLRRDNPGQTRVQWLVEPP
jgi:23S rRNA (adenine2030-N6)-methyltransferase